MGKQLRNSAGLNRPQYTEAAQKVAKLVYQHKTTPVLASLLSRDEKTNPTLARCKFFNAIVDAILISIKNESSLLIQEPDCFVYNDAIYSHVGGAEFAGAVLARALFIRVEEAEQFRKEFRTEYLPMYMDLVREVYSDAFKGNPPSDAPEKFIEVSTQRAYVDATFSLRMFQAFRASLVAESEAIILDETKKLELLVSGDVSSTVTSGNGAKKTLENIVTQKIAAEKTAAEKIAAEKAKIQQYDDIEEQLRIVVEISSQIKPEDVSNLQDEAELFSQVIMKALLASPTFQQKFDRILKSLVYEEQKSDILGLLGKNAKADEFFSMASQFLFRPHSQLQTAVYPQFWLQKVLGMYDSMKHNRASFDPKSVGASAYTHFYSDAIEGRNSRYVQTEEPFQKVFREFCEGCIAPLADQPSAKGRITNTPLQVVQNRLKEKDRYNKEKSKRNELKPFHLRAESAQEKLLQLQLKETASIQTETRKFLVTLEVLSAALIKVANDLTSEKSEQKKTKMIECARGLARDIDTIRAVARTVSLAFDDSVSAVTKETDKLIVSKAQSIQSLNCGMRNQISNYQKQIEEIYTAVPADVREGVSNAVVASQNEQATASEKSTGSIFSWIADTFMSFVSSRYYNTEHPDQAIAGAIGRFKLDARKIVQKMQSGRSVSNSSSSDPDEELFIPRSPSMSAVKAQ